MKESKFQRDLKKKIEGLFGPNECFIFKTDSKQIQGFPDLLILNLKFARWAVLECKKSKKAEHRPNQDFYISVINMLGGFARFIYPENEEEVLNDLKHFMEK